MISTQVLILVSLLALALGAALGFFVGLARTNENLKHAQEEAARCRVEAAESRGRAEALAQENSLLDSSARRDEALARLITPMATRLDDMNARVARMQTAQAAQESALRAQLEAAAQSQLELSRETTSLRSALTSTSARGVWGEVELRRIVEASGMLPHVDFSEQRQVDASNSAARPDLTVFLPGGGSIAIDSKVPLNALLRAEQIEGQDQRSLAMRRELLNEHARAMRIHLKELAKRDYPSKLEHSPALTIMFLPAESLLSRTLDSDPAFLEDALRAGISPATPATLLAVLRSVASVWSSSKATDEAQAILELGKTLTSRLATVCKHLDSLGGGLMRSVEYYNKAVASIESRVLTTARNFESLEGAPGSPRIIEGDAAQIRAITAPEIAPDRIG